jgi:CRP-like cAMP-binding protein
MAMVYTEDGREVIFSPINPGTYFGELSVLDGGPRSLAVLARAPVKVAVLPAKVFVALVDRVPLVRSRVMADLVARIRSLTQRTLELTTLSVEQRVISYVAALAVQHQQFRAGGVIENAPTHAEIGASIGTNREMISRIMSRLADRGLVQSARKRIKILDPLLFQPEI